MLSRLKSAAKRQPAVVRAVRSAYPALAWVSNRRAVYTRVAPYLAGIEFDEVRLTGRGNEPETHLRRTRSMIDFSSADVLVLGAGGGDELALWRAQHPRSLTAVDILPDIERAHTSGTRIARADVRALPFADDSFDLVASTALLEHVYDLDAVCGEMARVARPGAVIFANFGPLWHTYGGAHFEGAYEHLWMETAEFERYLRARAIPSEAQDGLRWLEHGMFSRLRYDEYLDVFRRHFTLDHVMIAVSQDAMRYRRDHPAAWRALLDRVSEADLLTFSMTVWMRPLPSSVGSRVAQSLTALEPRAEAVA